jgi:hypothetical protein
VPSGILHKAPALALCCYSHWRCAPSVAPDPAGKKIEKSSGDDWRLRAGSAEIRARPFGPIEKEIYQTDWKLGG